jgi:hypothetical protein
MDPIQWRGVWPYEARNNNTSGNVDSVMIEHNFGAALDARAPVGWGILATNERNVTWICTPGHSIPPGGMLAGFDIISRSNKAGEGLYSLTGNGGLATGRIAVPAN